MRFEQRSRVAHPADVVFPIMVERMEDLVPYMPNVESIETRAFERQADGSVSTVRRWQGTAKSVPGILRPFVTRNSLAWMDFATWYPAEYKVEWRIESKHSKISTCSGMNAFRPHPEAPETDTELVIDGEFVVFGDRLPGVPAFLGRRMAPTLERIIVGFMRPNFEQMGIGIVALLADQAPSGALGGAAPA